MRLVAFVLSCLVALPVFAAEQPLSIAAVVNDDIVTTLDVDNRMKLVLATTQLSDTPDVREGIRPQLLRGLIDERLQLQEAQSKNIEVSEDDLNQAIGTIEQQRGLPPGGLMAKLASLGVPSSTFTEQVRAQLAWTKLALRTLRPKVKVSEEELDRERRKVLQRGSGAGNEVEIELLALPVDKPENDAQVKTLAEKLVNEIRSGAPFESVARGLTGSANIKPFWITTDQLDPLLAQALESASTNTVTSPVRTLEGYTIVKLLNRRASIAAPSSITEVAVKEILLKLHPNATRSDVDLMLSIGKEVAKNPGNCSEKSIAGVQSLSPEDITVQFRRDNQDTMPEALKAIVSALPVGSVSEPFASQEGIRLFMLCERVEKSAPLADRDETMQRLLQEKLELEAQKYLRNLRRNAFIEIR